jgi:23S rRNA (pseudouridine1915-N3)-methyltransferase
MRLMILAIGRMKQSPERDLFRHYLDRIAWDVELRELEEKKPLPPAQLIAREADLLRAAIPEGAKIIALDSNGRALTSPDLANRLGQWRDEADYPIVFLIGGADGLERSLVKQADLALSFGAVTWPHMLMRGLLAEQIYRAQQILAGHPYHR